MIVVLFIMNIIIIIQYQADLFVVAVATEKRQRRRLNPAHCRLSVSSTTKIPSQNYAHHNNEATILQILLSFTTFSFFLSLSLEETTAVESIW